jgi:hypothetical protein
VVLSIRVSRFVALTHRLLVANGQDA